jgi:hypothetical protein
MAFGAVTVDAAIYRGPGNLHHSQLLDDGIVEGLVVPTVGFAQKDPHQLRFPRLAGVGRLCLRLPLLLHRYFYDARILDLD